MSYIDNAFVIFESLKNTEFENDLSSVEFSNTFLRDVKTASAYKKLKREYLKESQSLLFQKLDFSESVHKMLMEVLKKEHLEEAITKHMLFFLLWIWHNKYEMSRERLESLTRPIFLGIIGYAILDIYTDDKKHGKELIFLSFEVIRMAEDLFGQFFNINTKKIFDKHFSKFAKIEYLEKSNQWKNCPFKWKECWRLGLKASPSFSVYEILFNELEIKSEKINDLITGMIYMSAGIQLMDDLSDAGKDLENGIETLVMQGFYTQYGTDSENLQGKILEFLSDDKIEIIYQNGDHLFTKANNLFEKHNDEILIVFNEIQRYRFNSLFEFDEIK